MKLQFYPTVYRLLFTFFMFLPLFSLAQPSMRANIYIVEANGSTVLMDGNLTNYDSIYSNGLDMYDAWKMNNFSENFGILRSNSVLVIERRKNIEQNDTTFFKMWNMQYRSYRLQIITNNFNTTGMSAYLVDKFLDTKTPIKLNDTSFLDFTVNNNTGTWNPQRFELIYSKPEIPFQFISCVGSKGKNGLDVKWYVSNERSIAKYVVEHSLNGINFTDIGEVTSHSLSTNEYQFIPKNPLVTDNYYRIMAFNSNGTVHYSPVIKIAGEVFIASVFPNPITNQSFFVKIKVMTKQCQLQIVSVLGMTYTIPAGSINEAGTDLIKVSLPSQIYSGVYKLKIILSDMTTQVVTVRIL